MSITNFLWSEGETSPYNIYQFSGKLYDECNDNTFDTSGNVTSYINDCLGSSYQTTEQKYTYDALYQLIKVEGECKYSSLKDNYIERDDTYSQVFQYDNIGNLIRKTSQDSGVSGKAYTDYLSYDLEYEYNSDYAHRLNKIGRYYYQYDSNGNITAYSPTSFEPEYDIKIVQVNDKEWYLNYNILEGPKLKKRTPSWQRTIFYDDRNQMCEVSDFNSGKQNAYYHYDEDGKRTSKLIWNLQEVLSFGELFSLWLKPSNKWELGQTQKSIMLGNIRLVSKIDSAIKGSIRRWKDEHTFCYLQDHIGTANFITTYEGEIYQITEYTPYGERWIERTQNKYNEFYLPYRFAGKPLDEETGWYYFGARYYDPKYQIWTTSDPALADYFSDTQKGEGGVFNHINLNTYHYAGNNPIKYVDPDGEWVAIAAGTGVAYGLLALGALLCIKPAIQALDGLNGWIESYIPYRHNPNDNIEIYNPKNITSGKEELIPINIGNNQEVLIPTTLPLFKETYEGQISLPTIFTSNKLAPTYPPNNGVMGDTERHFLMPGDRIDRFGYPTGTYFSPTGTPLDMRSLPPGADLSIYSKYIVQKPFEVDKSLIAPHNGHFGFGTQYKSPVSAEVLIDKGIIKNED